MAARLGAAACSEGRLERRAIKKRILPTRDKIVGAEIHPVGADIGDGYATLTLAASALVSAHHRGISAIQAGLGAALGWIFGYRMVEAVDS